MRHGPLGPMHACDGWDGMARWDRRMHAAWLSAEVGAWWCTGWHRARRTRHGIMPSAWGVMPRARSRVGTRGAAPQVPVWRVGRTPTLTHASIGETMQVPTFPALPCGGSADETMLPIRSSGGAGHAPGVRNLAVRIICAGGHASALISRPRYVIIDPRPDLYQLVKLYWTSPIRLRCRIRNDIGYATKGFPGRGGSSATPGPRLRAWRTPGTVTSLSRPPLRSRRARRRSL